MRWRLKKWNNIMLKDMELKYLMNVSIYLQRKLDEGEYGRGYHHVSWGDVDYIKTMDYKETKEYIDLEIQLRYTPEAYEAVKLLEDFII